MLKIERNFTHSNSQLLDLPGIIEGAAQGKGRGRQVIAVARTSDLILMILDATKKDVHRDLLEAELDSVGIRLNQRPPNIYFKASLFITKTTLIIVTVSYITPEWVYTVTNAYIHNNFGLIQRRLGLGND